MAIVIYLNQRTGSLISFYRLAKELLIIYPDGPMMRFFQVCLLIFYCLLISAPAVFSIEPFEVRSSIGVPDTEWSATEAK
jgi:hypothetical protein